MAWILAAVIGALMLAVAGCGDDESSPTTAAAAPPHERRRRAVRSRSSRARSSRACSSLRYRHRRSSTRRTRAPRRRRASSRSTAAEYLGPRRGRLRDRADRHRDQRPDAGRQRGDDLQLRRRPDRAGRQQAADARHHGRVLGLADPVGKGESLFVAQVDFDETGTVMADMALEILGEEGGEFAILSASADAANQNAWIEAHQGGDQGPEVREPQARRHGLRQRRRPRNPTTRRLAWSTSTRTSS